MSKHLFNNLVKLGNNNPDLRENIKTVLHHLKKNAVDNLSMERMAESLIDKVVSYASKHNLKVDRAEYDDYGEEINIKLMHPKKPFGVDIYCYMLTTAVRDPDLDEGELMFDWVIETTGTYMGFDETEFDGWSVFDYKKGKIRDGMGNLMRTLKKAVKRTMGSDFRG